MCSRSSDHPGSGPVGKWLYPDGNIVIRNNDPNHNGD